MTVSRLAFARLAFGRLARAAAWGLALAVALARAQAPAPALPSFAELEAAGAVVGEIRIAPRDVFDTADPKENNALFRLANRLHVQTRPSVIRRALLFKPGDRLSARVIDETERVLSSMSTFYDVRIRPVAWHDGVVDIEVETRDTWSLDPGISAGRSGGESTAGIHVTDSNLLGTGVSLGVARSRSVDRTSSEVRFANERAFGTRVSVSATHAENDDGRRDAAAVVRPFYALDTRWAAGVTGLADDRIDAIYQAGNVTSEYRHRQRRADAFGAWSRGLVDGWVQRWWLGVALEEDSFEAEPGRVAPPRLPGDETLAGPYVRYDLIEDRYDRHFNHNLIGRPEYFALGLSASVRLGWSAPHFGASDSALRYAASVSRGFEPAPGHTLIASAALDGRRQDGLARRQRLALQAQYYRPQGRRWLFYASAVAEALTRPDVGELLLLGGDSGLRGYPLRYQTGQRRALLTLEERFYTDLYVWRLFRVGGAAFVDVGRAWRGEPANTVNPGWLGNAGIGLRIVSARAAFSNVLHVDVAFPLKASDDIRKAQFLVKTRTSF